jgi:hypothetical protein
MKLCALKTQSKQGEIPYTSEWRELGNRKMNAVNQNIGKQKIYGSSLFHKLILLSLQKAVQVTKLPHKFSLPHVTHLRSSKSYVAPSKFALLAGIHLASRNEFFFCGVAAKVQAGWMDVPL